MNTMRTRAATTTPTAIARITGILLLVMAVAGFAGFGIHSALIVPGDASATAGKIMASRRLFQLGFGSFLAFLCDVPVAILLYVLLRPVARTLALVSASFRLVYAAIGCAALLNQVGAMLLLSGAGHASAYGTAGVQDLALFLLDLFEHGFKLALVFFGFHPGLCGPPEGRISRPRGKARTAPHNGALPITPLMPSSA